MKPLELRLLPIGALRPAEYNPRKFSAKAHRKLKASLEQFGLVEPLVWNQRSGHVVGGHLRLRILHELGVTEVPVSVVDLGDAEEKALNVVLNNLEAQGRYDAAKLAVVLGELESLPELTATGFDASTLRSLSFVPELGAMEEPATGDTVEITLATDRTTYDALAGRLDELIREYDLESHVRFPEKAASPRRGHAAA